MTNVSLLPVALAAALEKAINATLALDPDTQARLGRLSGRVVAVELRGLGVRFYLMPTPGGLKVMERFDGEVDTTLRGTLSGLVRMGTGRSGEGLFTGEVQIEGDVELGQRFKRILEELNVDWEEHLSQLTGDVVAHQVGNVVRGLFQWGRDSSRRASRNLGEYLKEETDLFPTRGEVNAFVEAVDLLRSDSDRLEARIGRLRERLGGSQ